MTSVITRLQAAAEGNQEMDEAMLIAHGWTKRDNSGRPYWLNRGGTAYSPEGRRVPCPTRSLDSITRMIADEGMEWFRVNGHRRADGSVIEPDVFLVGKWADLKRASHPNDCLALCIALSKASGRLHHADNKRTP